MAAYPAARRPGMRFLGAILALAAASASACAPPAPGPSKAEEAFRKEVLAAREALSASLTDAAANREPQAAGRILQQTCSLARESGRPFACGITVLDRQGITLASATPGAPFRRLDYSRYDAVSKALKERRIVKTKLYLQDRSALYVVAIPLERRGEAVGLLVLTFDREDLSNRHGLTEEEFQRVDLGR
ncbi:MAG: hypothetical protein HPY67_16020 [Syntrophaceae bacterium]|nr:hypothetical protein [Syntrophaceae bacterium]